MVGLRRREGVAMGQIAIDYGLSRRALASLRQRLQPFLEEGLLLIEGDRWRLSDPTGLALSNAVLRELLGWWDERSGPAPTSEAPRSPDHDHRSGPG